MPLDRIVLISCFLTRRRVTFELGCVVIFLTGILLLAGKGVLAVFMVSLEVGHLAVSNIIEF